MRTLSIGRSRRTGDHLRATRLMLLALSLWCFAALPCRAEQSPAPSPAATAATQTNESRPDTPRATMLGYLTAARAGNYARAAEYLDLSHINPKDRASEGPRLARHLKVVLDRTLWVDLDSLSNAPAGEQDDGLAPRRDSVGTIQTKKGPVEILLERVPSKEGLVWKVAPGTVAQVPALYREFGYGPLGDILPRPLLDITFVEVALWQWIGLILLALVASLLSWGAAALIARLIRPVLERFRPSVENTLDQLIVGPVRLAFGIAIFYTGTFTLALAVPVQSFFNGAAKALTIIAVTWLALRVIDIVALKIRDHFSTRGQTAAVAMLPLGRRTIKVLLIALAVLALLENLGFNVTGIVAGLGVGGLAVALAAQETLKNFFGGVALITDQPVRVGDFCRFGDKIGTVEDVSLWSTRIRTLDRTVLSIPNAQFSTLQLENFARRDRIWLHPTIGLRYETTPDQMRYVLVEIKKLLLGHPRVSVDPARVRFTNFNAYSLDLEIFAYILTADYNEFLAIQEDIFLRIMDIVNTSGSGFAFPSQTVYFGRDGGLDEEKSHAAEAQVQQWRSQNALWLPNVPPQNAAEVTDILDYPPKGSATRDGGR